MRPIHEAELIAHVRDRVRRKQIDMKEPMVEWPVSDYTDPAVFAREIACLFRRRPIVIAHVSQLAAPGDYITHCHTGVPIVVLRNAQGELRAFLNVCRHRGSTLVQSPQGKDLRGFICPYHSWSYDTDGALVGVPDRIGFPALDEATRALTPLPVAERYGLVFVQPSPGAPLDMDSQLGALGGELAGFGIERHHLFHSEAIQVRANWKIAMDGTLEDYHFAHVHRATVLPLFHANSAEVDSVGPHFRLLTPRRSILELDDEARASWRSLDHLSPLYVLFPNLAILVPGDHFILFSVFPKTIDTTTIIYSVLVPDDPATSPRRKRWETTTRLSRSVIAEDLAVGEAVQSGFAAQANRTVLFGRFEHALTRFHRSCRDAIGEG